MRSAQARDVFKNALGEIHVPLDGQQAALLPLCASCPCVQPSAGCGAFFDCIYSLRKCNFRSDDLEKWFKISIYNDVLVNIGLEKAKNEFYELFV